MPFIEIDFFTALTTIFWIWMLADCIFNNRLRSGSKIFWILFIFFTHMLGAIIYYFSAATRKNPIDAINYYVAAVSNFFQQRSGSTQQPPPAPHYYPGYEEGYHAQAQAPVIIPPGEAAEQPLYQVHPEYEQPMATYPEMPPQEQ
jgi:hypothetical protein